MELEDVLKIHNMKAFIIQAQNWQQRIEINDTLFDNYSDMAMEAMTQSIERINTEKAENLMEEHAGESFMLGATIVAWGAPEGSEKIELMSEHIFGNAGCHTEADMMHDAIEREDDKP